MNRAKNAAPVGADAFMKLADGPLAPPDVRKAAPARKPDWGDDMKAMLASRVEGNT